MHACQRVEPDMHCVDRRRVISVSAVDFGNTSKGEKYAKNVLTSQIRAQRSIHYGTCNSEALLKVTQTFA